MNLETAQMNFGKAKTELEEAQKVYTDDASVKNSRRVDKARKSFEKAQRDLEAAEEIKEKADKKKGKSPAQIWVWTSQGSRGKPSWSNLTIWRLTPRRWNRQRGIFEFSLNLAEFIFQI